jgi:uncharacterized membrane protein YeaQ/YmgE (transglycosylase-associated protein family)
VSIELPWIVGFLLVGLAAGWLASTVMRSKRGILGYLFLGIVGSLVGGLLFSLLDLGTEANLLGRILIATVGAVLVLVIVK